MKDDDYIGSEAHFQDIQAAARKSTADQREPENLSEALGDLGDAILEMFEAAGLFRFFDKILVALGRVLIKMGFEPK